MLLKSWDKLPEPMRTDEVRGYYTALKRRRFSLLLKRIMDILLALILFLLLLPLMLIVAAAVKIDSRGPVFFRQVRITRYGREFRIFKFRTMVRNAEKIGAAVTTDKDSRVTRTGGFLRKYRLDETAQLLNILKGDMTFVGTRPEIPKYAAAYTPEMRATLLLPAGITSLASIKYKDEQRLLRDAENADDVYIGQILPGKMRYNLEELRRFGFWRDIGMMFRTIGAVMKRDKEET
ncbi:MAG: sugar transferase [Oscillospiraceae bacterium]|nr:sugar transferase [Oscillospiraceae bacterium]